MAVKGKPRLRLKAQAFHLERSEAPEEMTPSGWKSRIPAVAKYTVTRQFIRRAGV